MGRVHSESVEDRQRGDASITPFGEKCSAGIEDRIGYSCLLARARLRALVFVLVLLGSLRGPSARISDADAGTTDTSAAAAASASATPMPQLGPAIYATLPNLDTVAVYPLASNGNVPSLVGNAAISNPGGIGYWAGRLYVTNLATDSITVYPAGANGSPIVQAVDTITVYSRGSTGNIAPVRTISGALTRLSGLSGIAVDSSGNIYAPSMGVAGSKGAGILIFA